MQLTFQRQHERGREREREGRREGEGGGRARQRGGKEGRREGGREGGRERRETLNSETLVCGVVNQTTFLRVFIDCTHGNTSKFVKF